MKLPKLSVTFKTHIRYQLRQHARQVSTLFLPPLFLVIVVTLVGISQAHVSTEWLWVGVLLSVLMHLPQAFADDVTDGTLRYLQHADALFVFVWAKFIAWLLCLMLPLLAALPFVALLANMSAKATIMLAISLVFAAPAMIWLGLLGAAMTISAKQNVLILIILTLPLLLPIALLGIFSSTTPIGWLLLLSFDIFSATFMPFLLVFCLKIINQQ